MSTTAAVVVALVVFLLEGNGRIAVSNVLILSVDTLRADRVGVYGGPGITPAMDELGQRGVVFEQSLTPAPLTLPAHASLLSGLYPMNHGLRDNGTYRLSDSTTLLGEIFRQAGYRTAAFVGAFALDSRFHLDQGFELYDDEFGLRPDGRPAIERRAEEVVRSALAWIDTIGGHEPFFSFVHFFDPHAPYGAPSPFGERFSGRPYEGEVAYVDHALGRLLTGLQERGRLESTIVVVTADHGEGLGEHGERTHGLFAYETTLRIPLIFAGPRIPRGKRVETRVRLVDVYPTLLELAGLDVPPGLDGASLRSLLDGGSGRAGEQRDSYFEALTFHFNRDGAPLYGLYHETYKLIQVPIPELYDLSVDPNEERNIAGAKPELLGRMRSELSRLGVERHLEAAKDTETAADVETLERLSALGYLVGGRADASPARVYSEEDDPKRLLAVADKLDEAIEAYQQERPDEAIRLFQQVLTQRPGVATAYVYLAYVLRDQQRLDEAVLVLRAAIDHGVDTPSVRGLLGNYLQRLGQLPESVSILERLVRDHPEALEEREGLALSYAMMGRLEEARELFESILLVAPDHDRARLYLGEVFFELGRQDAAEESFRRVAETGRELRAEAWAGLGNVEALRGRREQAIDAWRRAVSLGYSDADTIFRLGIALAEVGQTQEAESRLAAFLAMTRVGDDFGAARAKAQALVNDLRRRPISAAP